MRFLPILRGLPWVLAVAGVLCLAAFWWARSSAAAPAGGDWEQKDRDFRARVAEINGKTGARQMSVEELRKKVEQGNKVVILDVRELKEMQVSMLPGARPAVPGQIRSRPLGDIPAEATVITYCTVGYRSGLAAVELEKRLGRPVYNLDGGILAWFNQGGEVLDPGGRPVDRIDAWGEPWTSFVHPR